MKIKYPIYIGVATHPGREPTITKVIAALKDQCDKLFVYDNGTEKIDLTDNGKFFGLTQINEPCYYLTVDSDLLYPPTYVADMIAFIDKHNTIATHHGRQLLGAGRDYYRGHRSFRCLNDTPDNIVLDVPGTGVTGFHTSYFNPRELWTAEDKKMSDLVFALEAIKQKKTIRLMGHRTGYITHLPIDMSKTICATESRRCERQSQIADEILLLKNNI